MIAEFAMVGEATLAQKNEDVLEAAVREHSQLVYRIAYSVVRSHADAEDITQETFLRALRYGRKFARIQDPKAWLARIGWRVAVERRRRQLRSGAGSQTGGEELPSTDSGAEQSLLDRERDARLGTLIESLPESLRGPLVLSALEELSAGEVAAALGISEAAVRSRAFRARQILRERMTTWMEARKP